MRPRHVSPTHVNNNNNTMYPQPYQPVASASLGMSTASHAETEQGFARLVEEEEDKSKLEAGRIHKQRAQAVICAITAHLCIGGIYTFSLFSDAIARDLGVIGAAEEDWNVSSVIPIFSLTITMAGLTAAFTGGWSERVGPNKPIALAGLLWGGGLLVCAFGLVQHSIFVVYLGYGFFGGLGIGLAYAPPVAGLIRWFPDRKGLASGLAIMGFGGGALLVSPIIRTLMNTFFVPPVLLGKCSSVSESIPKSQIVRPSVKDVSELGYPKGSMDPFDADEDCFQAATGSTGARETLAVLGLIYSVLLLLAGKFFIIAPNSALLLSNQQQKDGEPSSNKLAKQASYLPSPTAFVRASVAFRTSQFLRIWLSLFLNASAGIALLGVAKNVLTDAYIRPLELSPSLAATYVAVLSLSNGLGRIILARLSDLIGRKNTFTSFFVSGMFIYAALPFLFRSPSMFSFIIFFISTFLAVAVYGGGFAIAPAYLADCFGQAQVGEIYARLLTAWAAAGLFGPTALAVLRKQAEENAIVDLVERLVSLDRRSHLVEKFGEFQSARDFIGRSSATIESLLRMFDSTNVPVDQIPPDPRGRLYDTTMWMMACLLFVGFLINRGMRPVSPDIVEDSTSLLGGESDSTMMMNETNDHNGDVEANPLLTLASAQQQEGEEEEQQMYSAISKQ